MRIVNIKKKQSQNVFDQSAPKKSANLSINADLFAAGQVPQHQLSKTLEQHLAEIIRQAQRSQWLAENRDALDEYNRKVEKHSTFSDGLRSF